MSCHFLLTCNEGKEQSNQETGDPASEADVPGRQGEEPEHALPETQHLH